MLNLPDKAECAASGRVVDPTERHCEDGSEFVQLQEHALFHSREVILGAVVLLGIGYGIRRYQLRRTRTAPPTASG